MGDGAQRRAAAVAPGLVFAGVFRQLVIPRLDEHPSPARASEADAQGASVIFVWNRVRALRLPPPHVRF
jgi:hypothetical protein